MFFCLPHQLVRTKNVNAKPERERIATNDTVNTVSLFLSKRRQKHALSVQLVSVFSNVITSTPSGLQKIISMWLSYSTFPGENKYGGEKVAKV